MNYFEEGAVLLINKPLRWTSFDVVRKVRNLTKANKVGHAGTLDPLATGLLVVCTGKFTKRIQTFMAAEKEYTGTFALGATTPTFDLESDPGQFADYSKVSLEQLQVTAGSFTGEILQVPPAYSAIKQDGRRVYELARQGKEVILAARKIEIKQFDILKAEMPDVYFRVVCSTGTYIRSLANDFGAALGCGAYLSSLCRTRIGDLLLSQSMTIDQAETMIKERLSATGNA